MTLWLRTSDSLTRPMGGRRYAFRHVPSRSPAQCALNLMLSLHMFTRSTIRGPAGNKVADPGMGRDPGGVLCVATCRPRTDRSSVFDEWKRSFTSERLGWRKPADGFASLRTFRAFISGGSGLYWGCRSNPAMAINGRRNKPIGPGGSTRRLHHSGVRKQGSVIGSRPCDADC